jgi:uncharacterized protein YceK
MTRLRIVKIWVLALLAGLLFTGCASTRSTIDSRKKEKASAYASLPAETKALVDGGQIKIGMPMDAVYIAWGKPAQVLQNETPQGASTVWLYEGGWMEEMRWWPYYGRTPISDYQPRTYVRAEIVFVNGVVQSWRTLPQPRY